MISMIILCVYLFCTTLKCSLFLFYGVQFRHIGQIFIFGQPMVGQTCIFGQQTVIWWNTYYYFSAVSVFIYIFNLVHGYIYINLIVSTLGYEGVSYT